MGIPANVIKEPSLGKKQILAKMKIPKVAVLPSKKFDTSSVNTRVLKVTTNGNVVSERQINGGSVEYNEVYK